MREDVEAWIREHVAPTGPLEIVHERPWSTVVRVPVATGAVWFKACAPVQAFEDWNGFRRRDGSDYTAQRRFDSWNGARDQLIRRRHCYNIVASEPTTYVSVPAETGRYWRPHLPETRRGTRNEIAGR